MKSKKAVTAAMAATLMAGVGIGSFVAPPMTAFAANSSNASATARTPGQWITDSLKGLVDKGTITQSQSDAVASALKDAQPKGSHGRGGRIDQAAAATALGMTEADLRTAEQTKSITDIAKDKNVDLQKVIDALVAAENTRIDKSVTDGRITQAQADERKANTLATITEEVKIVHTGGPAGRDKQNPPSAPPAGSEQAPAA